MPLISLDHVSIAYGHLPLLDDASLKVDAVLISVTGILAFYQTKVPYHRKGKFLGSRDFFGECCAAARKRGLHAIARMSPDLNWEDAVQAHPEWFQRDAQGNAVHHGEDPRLFRTCMFTTYMTDYMTAIMKEINSLYDVDGMFTNAWPPLGALPVCHCEQCNLDYARSLPFAACVTVMECPPPSSVLADFFLKLRSAKARAEAVCFVALASCA